MALPSFSKRTPPKQRLARTVSANETEADVIARGKAVQDYTKPALPKNPGSYDDLPMGKLIRAGGKFGRRVIKRLTGKDI